jgi:hypothetical protein
MNILSFRDPSGKIITKNKKILRIINNPESKFFKKLFSEAWYKKLVQKNLIQESIFLKKRKNYSVYSHKEFFFPIFANQFCAEQLYQAGILTLEIAIEAIKNNISLKDASAWNVVFDNAKPIFIDVTSFENYKHEKVWFAYGQFCRHFIIPLILHNEVKLKISDFFNSYRDGLDPIFAKNILGIKSLKSLSSIETIFLPSLFNKKSRKVDIADAHGRFNKEIYLRNILRLKKYLESNRPKKSATKWADYEEQKFHYSNRDLILKKKFISEVSEFIKGPALDLGCNRGEYSIQLAQKKIKVVSSDFDQDCLNQLQANLNNSNITVCDLNIANPTAAIGWDNKEHKSFIEKAKNKFDLVMCLGLLHHLIISERIPIDKILKTFSLLSKRYLLIEFVDKTDQKFIEIAKSNLYLYEHFTEFFFEKKINNLFTIKKKKRLSYAKRSLYLLKKK